MKMRRNSDYVGREMDLQERIDLCLSRLSVREQEIIKHRFGLCGYEFQTLQKLGERYSVSRNRIRQVEAKALRKLRHPNISRGLRELL